MAIHINESARKSMAILTPGIRRTTFWLSFVTFNLSALAGLRSWKVSTYHALFFWIVIAAAVCTILSATCILRGGQKRSTTAFAILIAIITIPMVLDHGIGLWLLRAPLIALALYVGYLAGPHAAEFTEGLVHSIVRSLVGRTSNYIQEATISGKELGANIPSHSSLKDATLWVADSDSQRETCREGDSPLTWGNVSGE